MRDVEEFLDLGSIEAAIQKARTADVTSPRGRAVEFACHLLAMRDIERAVNKLNTATSWLMVASIIVGASAGAAAFLGLAR